MGRGQTRHALSVLRCPSAEPGRLGGIPRENATASKRVEQRTRRGVPVLETQPAAAIEGTDVPCQFERLTDASFKVTLASAAQTPVWVRVSETFLPGWSAEASEQPLTVAAGDVAFVSTLVPAGATQVTFRYAPPGWARSVGVSLGSLLTILLLAALAWRARTHD